MDGVSNGFQRHNGLLLGKVGGNEVGALERVGAQHAAAEEVPTTHKSDKYVSKMKAANPLF